MHGGSRTWARSRGQAEAKDPRRQLFVHDVFGMIPPPSDEDGAESMSARRRSSPVAPRASAANDTLTGDEPVALAHIDGDWYESVLTCLVRIGPRLSSRGVMVIDDYFYWSGCRRAVDEFLAEHPGEYRTVRRTRLHIEKN